MALVDPLLAFGQILQGCQQFGRFGLLALDHLPYRCVRLIDPHLQRPDHLQLGQLVDERRFWLLARGGCWPGGVRFFSNSLAAFSSAAIVSSSAAMISFSKPCVMSIHLDGRNRSATC